MEIDILESPNRSSILRNCLKSVCASASPRKAENSGIFSGLQCGGASGCRINPLNLFGGSPPKSCMDNLKNMMADPSPSLTSTRISMSGAEAVSGLVEDKETMTEEMGSQTEQDQFHASPCDPGTFLYLEGVVWHETPDGVLVVNITWRGRNYVGTLLDHTKYDWAGTSYTDVSEEKRSSKARGVNFSNSCNGYSPNTGVGKRNSGANSGLYNTVPANNSSSSSSSAGGRTTNNSIAAEYDANSKIKVHAVSPLVGSQNGQSGLYPNNNGANTPGLNSGSGNNVNLATGKAKRACNMSGSRTPPPLSIVEDQGMNSSLAGTASTASGANLKRKSEKNSSVDQGGVFENKTGKKPRVTITNIGANNETLTTVLNTTLPSDNLWKCSEPSCSKKYKHKNGLRYHITHAHNKSEAEADVIIENEMTSHYAQITIASTTDTSAIGDEECAEGGKMTSPNSMKGSGKKTPVSRKMTIAREKKKRRESDDSPPSNSELGSSHGSNDSSELASGNVSSNSTPPITCANSPSTTTATLKSSISTTSNVKETTTLVRKTPPSSSRLGSASSSVPLQQADPTLQPERKVAKVAPTSFGGGSDSPKYKASQHLESNVKLEPNMTGPSGSKTYKTQNSHFHVQTPIYPFGPVDPKLYTNFVVPTYAAHAHGGDSDVMQGQTSSSMAGLSTSEPHNSNGQSPKPEGTAARIVHQQHPSSAPMSHHQGAGGPQPSGTHGNQAWGVPGAGFMQGSTGVHHITTTVSAANNGAHGNWKPPDVANAFVDNPATKFVEANAQHIAEATVQAVSTHHQQLQAPPASPSGPTSMSTTATIASHHVHNHIHNYVGFPPPAQMGLAPPPPPQGHSGSANQQQNQAPPQHQNNLNPQSPQVANPARQQTNNPKQVPNNANLSSQQQQLGLGGATSGMPGHCNLTGQMTAGPAGQAGPSPVANTNIRAPNPNQSQNPTTSSSSSQFASLVQGRPLAPVSPFNATRAGQS